ncbi:MAG: hypothetical protein AB7G37_05050 [Solirubrobacteraceae bacterium]
MSKDGESDREETEDEEFPWPRAGDVLFQAADDWVYNGLVWNFLDGTVHAAGFKEAADALVARIGERDRSHEFLVYPIVFCYRHYLELSLKNCLRTAQRYFELGDDSAIKKVLGWHSLVEIWKQLRPLLEFRWPDKPGDPDAVEHVLGQFDDVDERSDAFRYPINKNGEPSLGGTLREHGIDVRNVHDVVTRVGAFLEAADGQLCDELAEAPTWADYR